MDLNLILSAQTLSLAPQLQRSERNDGLLVLKNIPAKTYLRVTPEQWIILQQFEKPRTVPAVLGGAIQDRVCLPLGEFFELILKALRAHILLEPGIGPGPVEAYPWRWAVRPQLLARPLLILFCTGMVLSLGFRPELPSSVLDVLVGLLLLSATRSSGTFLAGCMVRGAGGEVYRPHWRWRAFPPHFGLDTSDAIILPVKAQEAVDLARPTLLAAVAGIVAWHRPAWALFPLLGLMISLRPFLGGHFAALIHFGRERGPSDAEQIYVFPPNQRPELRGRLLVRALRQPNTWVRIAYGVLWTIIFFYWVARLTNRPLRSFAFWEINGLRAAKGMGISLAVLAVGYLLWEVFYFVRLHARAGRNIFRLWHARWFGGRKLVPDESSRMKMVAESPLFGSLPPPEHLEVARAMRISRYGPWKTLPNHGNMPTHVSLIVSGEISVKRELSNGRAVRAQVLSEGDVIGLHDLADPKFPRYLLRSLTPVTLLTMDRMAAEELAARRIPQATLTDIALKLPFLRQTALCRNWHPQAVERFARLTTITDYRPGDAILSEGQTVQDFFIIFQGNARVTKKSHLVGVIHSGEFFGEIGLMQNSSPNATVIADQDTRCLSISRVEFLRFVTHNYTVALELERVSSERLGHPLFPLKQGDFRAI